MAIVRQTQADVFRVMEGALLAETKLGPTRRTEIAECLYGALEDSGLLAMNVAAVEVPCARVPVETVEAYGLEIQLDAHGDAVSIRHPDGFMVSEVFAR